MDYNLTVSIDIGILPFLVNGGYKLCIAKKVNGVYTVIWQGSNVLANNQFSWSSKFQVIASGQSVTLDNYGIMNAAHGTSDESGKFTVQNNYGLINLGVNSYVNGVYAPSYVSEHPVVSGPTVLEPIETIMVWFETNVTTGTMILDASSQATEVDFTSIPTHTLLYKVPDGSPPGAGVWYHDSDQAVLPMTYHLRSNSFSIPEPSEATLALMSEFLNAPPSGRRPAFTAPVVAFTDFATHEGAAEFEAYMRANKPGGFARWDVSKADHVVSVSMEVGIAANKEASVRAASDKYLELLYAFQGPQFEELRLTVNGRAIDPIPRVDHTELTIPDEGGLLSIVTHDQTIGTAIVRFPTPAGAASFAEQVNHARSPGVELKAIPRGPGVTVKFETLTKGRPEAARKRIHQTYEAAIAAFNSIPENPEPVYVGTIVWGEQPEVV
ncbi:hypothetical protein C2E23DRAFT_732983 [Lenzites betulinus]|nr:hypothetical protein C2E23DRAFT_732983 [Lenzites betulinus]